MRFEIGLFMAHDALAVNQQSLILIAAQLVVNLILKHLI